MARFTPRGQKPGSTELLRDTHILMWYMAPTCCIHVISPVLFVLDIAPGIVEDNAIAFAGNLADTHQRLIYCADLRGDPFPASFLGKPMELPHAEVWDFRPIN